MNEKKDSLSVYPLGALTLQGTDILVMLHLYTYTPVAVKQAPLATIYHVQQQIDNCLSGPFIPTC